MGLHMSAKTGYAIVWGSLLLFAAGYIYTTLRACRAALEGDRLGAGRTGVAKVGDGQWIVSPGESRPPQPGPHSSLSETAASSALPSPPGPDGALSGAASWSPTGDSPGGVYSQPFSFEGLESPHEAVLANTLDLWNSEGFKKLTLAEVRALLCPGDAVDSDASRRSAEQAGRDTACDSYDLSGDGLLLDRIGGLPTEEDVITALDSPAVTDALYRFLVADGIALEFSMQNKLKEIRDDAVRARDAAQDGLFKSLDAHSGYKNWALLGAVWRALDRE